MINFDLAEKIKGMQPFYQRAYFNKIFSWKELEALLNLRPFVNDKRFYIHSGKEYNWTSSGWSSDQATYPADILQEELQHYNCYFRDSSRVNKEVNEIAKDLETITGYPTDAHIYFSLNDEEHKEFGIHNDISHNFIVQVEGTTRFRVWNFKGLDETTVENVEYLDKPPYIEVDMNPGDAIFIPKKYWHSATSTTKRMSISFPIVPIDTAFFECRDWLDIDTLIKS
jgi:hypothetical protein